MDIIDSTYQEENSDGSLLSINQDYAKVFTEAQEQKELKELKKKYGKSFVSSDSEPDALEDEFGELYTDEREKAFANVLWHIRHKSDALDDESKQWWPVEADSARSHEKADTAELQVPHETLKTQMTNKILYSGLGATADQDETSQVKRKSRLIDADVDKSLQKGAIEKLDGCFSDSEDVLVSLGEYMPLQHTSPSPKGHDDACRAEAPNPSQKRTGVFYEVFGTKDSEKDDDDEFLRHYFRTHGWKNEMKHENDSKIPDVDDDTLETMADTGAADDLKAVHTCLQQHPREQRGAAIRERGSSRQEKRARKAQRLEEQHAVQEAEIQRLRNLKRNVVDKRINMISRISGSNDIKRIISEKFLASEFDADDWDKQMNVLFGEEYYEESENNEDVKGIEDNSDWSGIQELLPKADHQQYSEIDAKDEHLKNELELLQKEIQGLKDLDGLNSKSHENNFRYTSVTSGDAPLSPDEILFYDDRVLNEVAPLRWYAPYVTEKERRKFKYMAKAKRSALKQKSSRAHFKPSKKYREPSASN